MIYKSVVIELKLYILVCELWQFLCNYPQSSPTKSAALSVIQSGQLCAISSKLIHIFSAK